MAWRLNGRSNWRLDWGSNRRSHVTVDAKQMQDYIRDCAVDLLKEWTRTQVGDQIGDQLEHHIRLKTRLEGIRKQISPPGVQANDSCSALTHLKFYGFIQDRLGASYLGALCGYLRIAERTKTIRAEEFVIFSWSSKQIPIFLLGTAILTFSSMRVASYCPEYTAWSGHVSTPSPCCLSSA